MDDKTILIQFKTILTDHDLEKFLEDFPVQALFPKRQDKFSHYYFLNVKFGEENNEITRIKQAYSSIIEKVDVMPKRYAA